MTLTGGDKILKSEKRPKTSPENIVREETSSLAHELGQPPALGNLECLRVDTRIENHQVVAKRLVDVASDKERNPHLLEGVNNGQGTPPSVFGIRPKQRDLKRKQFGKFLYRVGLSPAERPQRHRCGS